MLSVKRNERKTAPAAALRPDQPAARGQPPLRPVRRRTLAAAQRLYEGSAHGAVITYPRTRIQFLPSDQIPTLKRIAGLAGAASRRTNPHAEYVAGLDVLPLARVVNDGKVDDHHAIIPTGDLPRGELSNDDRRVYDLICRRYLAVFHPEARFEDTEVVTEAGGSASAPRAGGCSRPAGAAPPSATSRAGAEKRKRRRGAEQTLPRIDEGERGTCTSAEVLEKQTKPPGRYTEASLLGAMETAGRAIDDEELREAMKDSGLGTPATRADTIERLLNVGYIERDGKALAATTKGRDTIELLGTHALTSAELTGSWEKRLSEIEHGQADRAGFMADIARFTEQLVDYFREIRTESLGACPNGDGDVIENRSAFGCSSYKSKKEPGCGFTIWKTQAGFTIDRDQVRALLEKGEVELHGPVEARLVLAEGNTPEIVDAAGAPIASRRWGRAPTATATSARTARPSAAAPTRARRSRAAASRSGSPRAASPITADDVRQLLEQGEAQLESAAPARLVLVDGNQPAIVDSGGKPLTGALGPCPNGDGEIKENRRAFGCSSWKSKDEPGCGFTIWKSQKGYVVNEAEVRTLLEHGEATLAEGPQPAKLILGEGNVPQIVGLDGAPLVRSAAAACHARRSPPARAAAARSAATAAPMAARPGRAARTPGAAS